MIDFLYTNGCSWTAGHGIQDDPAIAHIDFYQRWDYLKLYAWPATLAHLMNVDHCNEGEGAGSNKRILRKTIEFLHKYPKEKYQNLLVVLGWTTVDRNEFHIKENETIQGWCRCNANQPISGYPTPDFSKGFTRELDEWHKLYLNNIFNLKSNYTYFFQEMWLMSNLLENLGIKYIFFNSLPWKYCYTPKNDSFNVTTEFSREIKEMQNKKQILSVRDCDDVNNIMSEFIRINNLPMAKDHHTMIQGHSAWAKHLFTEYENLYPVK